MAVLDAVKVDPVEQYLGGPALRFSRLIFFGGPLVTLLFGLCIGSFLNVVIYRLPIMMQREWRSDCLEFLDQPAVDKEQEAFNLVVPRSRCGQCGHQITALENIPIISYLLLKGKCSSCQAPISLQYPLVELFTGLISMGRSHRSLAA